MSLPPTFHFVEISETDEASRRISDKENGARQASVEIRQPSSGAGQHRLTKPIIFPIVFREEPHFSFGSAVIRGPKASAGKYHDPRGSSGVVGWKRQGKYFTGALLWLRVDCDLVDPTQDATAAELAGIQVQHYFTFSALAVKAVPTKAVKADMSPRAIGLYPQWISNSD